MFSVCVFVSLFVFVCMCVLYDCFVCFFLCIIITALAKLDL